VPKGFLPNSDTGLLRWSANFSSAINADPGSVGLTALLAANYASLHADFASKLAACDPNIRNKAGVVAKNTSRENLKNDARLLARLIYGTASVTDTQKASLGLNVRKNPTPIPRPENPPVIGIVSVRGWTVTIKLQDHASGDRRGKPPGVQGASVFSYSAPPGPAATPPADLAEWTFEGNFGKTRIDLNFPSALPPGTTVWLAAFWFNPRAQAGPVCPPVSTNLQGGAVANSGSLALAA
jgi:hypothetical protein